MIGCRKGPSSLGATRTQRTIIGAGSGLAAGGSFELLLDVNPVLPIAVGLLTLLVGIFAPIPQQIDAEIERQFDAVRRSWALFGIAVCASVVLCLLIIDLLHVKTASSEAIEKAGRHLSGDARMQFRTALFRPDNAIRTIYVSKEGVCDECNAFANDIRGALSGLPNVVAKAWQIDGDQGPPSGLTIYGDGCDERESYVMQIVEAFQSIGHSPVCEQDSLDEPNAYVVYVSRAL